jgi:hypothetical protein
METSWFEDQIDTKFEVFTAMEIQVVPLWVSDVW